MKSVYGSIALLLLSVFSSGLTIRSASAEVMEGVLQTLYEDFPDGKTAKETLVLIREGKPYVRLDHLKESFRNILVNVRPGSKIRLTGTTTQSSFIVGGVDVLETLPDTRRSARTGATADFTNTVAHGERKIAIVPLRFSNGNTPPCDMNEVFAQFGPEGGVTKHYRENFQGKLSFDAVLMEPVEVMSERNCDDSDWQVVIRNAITARGFDVNQFRAIVSYVPTGAWCPASYTLTGRGPTGIVMHPAHCQGPGPVGHELGHHLGWGHAQSPTAIYGDYSDIMGFAYLTHSNAPHKISGGLINPAQIIEAKKGYMKINSLAGDSTSGPRVLRGVLSVPQRISNQDYSYYYISFRGPDGMDATALAADRLNRTYVHFWSDWIWGTTLLVGNVQNGETMQLTGNPVTVQQISNDGKTAEICIKIAGEGDCNPPPLPVTLISFSGAATAGAIRLTWKTTDQKNFDRFDVEQSTNGTSWAKVGTVGNNVHLSRSRPHEYAYSIKTSGAAASVYFRLKMVDLDATFSYSKIINVKSLAGSVKPSVRAPRTRGPR